MTTSNNAKLYKTRNINKALQSYADDNLVPISECDFSIKNVTSYIKTIHDKDFRLFNSGIEHYTQEQVILNEHVEFHQIYTIEVVEKKICELALDYTIEMGEFVTDPKIIINANSKIPYKSHNAKEIYFLLKKEFNKIKARHSMLIHIFDAKMLKNLKAFTKYIYAGKLTKKVRLPLFDGIEPEVSREGKLILWFEQKRDKHKIVEVEAGELLAEYKKPVYGHNGFNAYGKQVDDLYETNLHDIDAKIDPNSILIEETEKSKLYKSKCKGYVNFNGETLAIDNKVRVSKISRVEESLAKNQDNNIEVHIAQHDTTKDSIGEGVELTSETIMVHGHVGANSTLMSVNLNVEGATHQDSSQYAKFAKINRHKGMLRCHEAKIKLLEGGTVHATNVEIEACLNGTIYAQNVTINHVKSNLKVYASESISIRLVSGEDNLFKINYNDIPILRRKLELLDEEIEEYKYYLDEAKRHSKEKIPSLKEKLNKANEEKEKIQSSSMRATISIEKPLRGLNTIIFTLNKENELIYKTEEREYEPFHLLIKDDKVILHPTSKSLPLQ
ncbi:MAG: DUF342 domain-containing protein [Helicobacteraceae bacterium]|nr:DUF342 domain-containing protein [Helicobacteraceae bacterium]